MSWPEGRTGVDGKHNERECECATKTQEQELKEEGTEKRLLYFLVCKDIRKLKQNYTANRKTASENNKGEERRWNKGK